MAKAIKGWHTVVGVTEEELQNAKREVYAKYGDIIRLPHPVSKSHKPLSLEQRAAQFSPFAALKGYGEALDEAACPPPTAFGREGL